MTSYLSAQYYDLILYEIDKGAAEEGGSNWITTQWFMTNWNGKFDFVENFFSSVRVSLGPFLLSSRYLYCALSITIPAPS